MPDLFNKLTCSPQPASLRERIALDIVGLLNSAARSARLQFKEEAPVMRSVLNYGNPPLTSLGSSRVDPHRLARHIHKTLEQFEPRISAQALVVQARLDTDDARGHRLYFDIQSQLRTDDSTFRLRLALDYLSASFHVMAA